MGRGWVRLRSQSGIVCKVRACVYVCFGYVRLCVCVNVGVRVCVCVYTCQCVRTYGRMCLSVYVYVRIGRARVCARVFALAGVRAGVRACVPLGDYGSVGD